MAAVASTGVAMWRVLDHSLGMPIWAWVVAVLAVIAVWKAARKFFAAEKSTPNPSPEPPTVNFYEEFPGALIAYIVRVRPQDANFITVTDIMCETCKMSLRRQRLGFGVFWHCIRCEADFQLPPDVDEITEYIRGSILRGEIAPEIARES